MGNEYWHEHIHDEEFSSGRRKFCIALAGNPNCGKTTMFNLLTGARQHVGNYPGVTVERVTGHMRIGELQIEVIDLPGIYSLSNSSPEEKVAFQELRNRRVDLILDVVDATNPQRNLYLTTQLAELDVPMLLAFNMIDDARNRGLEFDFPMLERYFNCRIVPTSAASGEGVEKLKSTIAELFSSPRCPAVHLSYGESTDAAIAELSAEITRLRPEDSDIPPRFFALKLLENDPAVSGDPAFAPVTEHAAQLRDRLAARHGVSHEIFMADRRYGMISGACREAIRVGSDKRRQFSDNIDKVVTNRFLGLPIFLAAMFLVFAFTFGCAEPLTAGIEFLFVKLAELIGALWPQHALPFLRALTLEGVIGGVGGVLIFLPNILLLFLAIAFLEGTGYMARAAFVMDGFMHKIGLHGKSFIPMLLGFGCSVPAVMATRTIESRRDRLTTIMVIPLMSCGARLPIYVMFSSAFFSNRVGPFVIWGIYLFGVALALLCARLLKSTLFKGGDEVFVMELPPYRMPTFRSMVIHMWERAVMYLKKAGTIILGASVILFILSALPEKTVFSRDYDAAIAAADTPALRQQLKAERQNEKLQYSLSGRIGKKMAVVLEPAGFDWKLSSALIGAFAGKELFVAQLGILYSVSDSGSEVEADDTLRAHIRGNYTPLQGVCIMLFCLISMPCVATIAAVRRETNSWALTLLQLGGLTLLAYLVSLAVYQCGTLLEAGTRLL